MQVILKTFRRTTDAPTAPAGSYDLVPAPRVPTLAGRELHHPSEATRTLVSPHLISAVVSSLVVAVAVVSATLAAAAPAKPLGLSPAPTAPHAATLALHASHVQHGNHEVAKWLVERPTVAPPVRWVYRSPGAIVGPAGGIYRLILTA